jgi:flagellar assembly factor FliW
MNWIQSAQFGRIEYSDEQVITFPKGLPGFDTYTRFTLFPLSDQEELPFYFLQSVEEGDLGFLVLNPFQFFPDYELKLDDDVVEQLHIEKPEDVLVLTTVTVPDTLQRATTNLKAPLVINVPKRLAKQVVLENRNYLIKQPLFMTEQQAAQGQKG